MNGKNILFTLLLVTLFSDQYSFSKTVYISSTGLDTNPGTLVLPYLTISKAVSSVSAGDTMYMRGGIYALSSTISISKSGTSAGKYNLWAYFGEHPLLDFSGMAESSSNRGINLSGSYWYIKGIDIKGAGDNGMNISGSNNTVEYCSFYLNRDSGLQLGGGATSNRIINCDSYFNKDAGEGNADGFAVKLDVGTGNYYYGCRSWQNSDDGWDGYLRPSDDITTTLENCWCFMNGYRADGTASTGNGNGFKMGGSDLKTLRHNFILKNCLSFDNRVKGFDQNNNKGSMTLLNCTAYRNGTNYSVTQILDTASGKILTLTNCVALGSYGSISISSVQTTNSWMSSFTVTNADFLSIDTAGIRGPRNADGSLPQTTFMHLAAGSDLIDAGTNIGLPFNGSAPDLGVFESGAAASLATLATTAISSITQTTAISGGSISSDGGATVSARGVCWSTSASPTIADSHTSDGTGAGSYTSAITGLSVGSAYYVRAYATNSAGTAYGTQVSFTSLPATAATVTTTAITAITQTTATGGGNVAFDGGSTVTMRGACWNTTGTPFVSGNHTSDNTGTGIFASSLTGLTAGTTYYVRAFAINSIDTAYGTQVSFTTTAATIPTVTTASISDITSTTASSGGSITSNGGVAITAKGVCWNLTGTPMLTDAHTSDGTGSASFVSSIPGLVSGATYYVRAYAVNTVGAGYGAESVFTTLSSGQADSIIWALTANTGFSATANLNGSVEAFSSGGGSLSMSVKDYANGGQRCNLGAANWPTETAQNDGRYIEFAVSPVAGYIFLANSVSLDIGYAASTNRMFSNLYYSTDNWAHKTKINADAIISANSSWNSPAPSFTCNVTVASGTNLAIRIYPWFTTTPSNSKYLGLKNFVIKGNTSLAVLPPAVLNLSLAVQGYFNGTTAALKDTFKVKLAEKSAPYTVVDSAVVVIDSVSLTGSVSFQNASTGSYYLVIRHRSAVETWSASPVSITRGALQTYDFTSMQTQAYGNNLMQNGSKWCLYNGDVDQSGYIDNNDLLLVDNAAFAFSSGYLPTDIDGNRFVDNNDLLICDNNAYDYVSVHKPLAGGIAKRLSGYSESKSWQVINVEGKGR